MSLNHTVTPALRFGARHGYRIEGDRVLINADLEVLDAARAGASEWALQLWASDAPFAGAVLAGTKVAELALAPLAPADGQALVAGSAFAVPPAGSGDKAMTLVLAAGRDGRFDAVQDAVSYPRQERFVLPRLAGNVAYRIDGEFVEVSVDAIENPRCADNLSGNLALELWALGRPYAGGDFSGVALLGADLGVLAGGGRIEQVCRGAHARPLPAGRWHLVLMLREWTETGFVTRDYSNFPSPHVVADHAAAPAAAPLAAAVAPEPAAAAAAIQLPAAEAPAAQETAAERVSVNKAKAAELAAIKGLSKALAAAIVAGRPYASWDALLAVKGMGPKLLARLRDQLAL